LQTDRQEQQHAAQILSRVPEQTSSQNPNHLPTAMCIRQFTTEMVDISKWLGLGLGFQFLCMIEEGERERERGAGRSVCCSCFVGTKSQISWSLGE